MPAQIRHRLTPEQRQTLLDLVIRDGANISIACKKFQVSRTTFYRWCKKYTSSAASNQTRKKTFLYTSSVYRKLENSIRKLILASDPILSKYTLHKIFQENHPDIRIGIHGFYNILVRLHLNTSELRERFIAKSMLSPRAWTDSIPGYERVSVVERVLHKGMAVNRVSQELSISRATLHRWIRAYKNSSEFEHESSLGRRRPLRDQWPGQATDWQRSRVLDLVTEYPNASKYELALLFRERFGDQALGVHGVYNVLRRNQLTRPEQRVVWAQTQQAEVEPVSQTSPVTGWSQRLNQVFEEYVPGLTPAPPPLRLRSGLGTAGLPFFRQLRRFSTSVFLCLLILFAFFEWGQLLGSSENLIQALGWLFASSALLMGTLFFIYSLKYYFTLAVVLSFSREADPSETSKLSFEQRKAQLSSTPAGWLRKLFGINLSRSGNESSPVPGTSSSQVGGPASPYSSQGGLEPDLTKVRLERHPFISVHLPMYNEPRVAERILRACTSFDYPPSPSASEGQAARYEVVVADDSTDETTEIVRRFAEQWNHASGSGNGTEDVPGTDLPLSDGRQTFTSEV